MSAPQRLTIGRLAASAGTNLETVRYYERVGLMPEPDRSEGGHRHYRPEHRERLTFIRRARELGFSLDDVRALLSLNAAGPQTCAEARAIAANHLQSIRAKIADLRRLERVLRDAVARCDADDLQPCPVIEVLTHAA